MAGYISSQEFQHSENDFNNRNSNRSFNKAKRKRITYFPVDKPINHPFPIEAEHELSISIGE